MTSNSDTAKLARTPGSTIEHDLHPFTKVTRCGKDATYMNRYPYLTQGNSSDRRVWKTCPSCKTAVR